MTGRSFRRDGLGWKFKVGGGRFLESFRRESGCLEDDTFISLSENQKIRENIPGNHLLFHWRSCGGNVDFVEIVIEVLHF